MLVLYLQSTHSHCTFSFRPDYLFKTNSCKYRLCVQPKRVPKTSICPFLIPLERCNVLNVILRHLDGLWARMADDMGINIQVGRYSTVSINLSNILEFYLVVVENSSFMHPYYRRRKVIVSLSSILFVVVFRQKYSQI